MVNTGCPIQLLHWMWPDLVPATLDAHIHIPQGSRYKIRRDQDDQYSSFPSNPYLGWNTELAPAGLDVLLTKHNPHA